MYMRNVFKLVLTTLFCVIIMASGNIGVAQAATFNDVPESYAYYDDIEYLSQQHIVSGSTGQFRPNAAITSSEWAVMLCRTFAADELASYKNVSMKTCFDLAYQHGWYTNEITYNQKMTNGYCAYSLLKAIGVDARHQMNSTVAYQNKWLTAVNLIENMEFTNIHVDFTATAIRGYAASLLSGYLDVNEYIKEVNRTTGFPIVSDGSINNLKPYYFEYLSLPQKDREVFESTNWKIEVGNGYIDASNKNTGRRAIGIASPANEKIFLKSPEALIHEFGHFVGTKNYLYTDSYQLVSDDLTSAAGFMSTYAFSNNAEFFADAYLQYVTYRHDPSRMALLQQVIPDTYDYLAAL